MITIRTFLIYIVSLLFLSFLFLLYLGAARYVTDFEDNTCDMTYMFEYPQYVRVALDSDIEESYPRYGLYAYGEGFLTEKLRRMHFTGIPVLFIPGNAGSHEQVRSLASVSLRKTLKSRTPVHFDFFTVSFGKDYSGLYGGVLMDETIYVSHCIKRILKLYKNNVDNVILIGHSMGGIVAKGTLLLLPNMNASYASVIISLAAPHVPSLVLDSTFANYYYNIEKEMYKLKEAKATVISIGGGPRDILVTGAQAIDSSADINVLSTSIPDVWLSTDHLSILWCKQLVLAIIRSLFDTVNTAERPHRVSSDLNYKIQAMSYHYLHRASGKRVYQYKEKIQFEPGGEWIENILQQYVWFHKGNARSTSMYLMIRLSSQSDYLTVDTINVESKDWLFVCSATKIQRQSRVCDWGWNLSNLTRMTPDPGHRLRKTVDLNLQDIKLKYPGMSHVVVRISPNDLDKMVTVNVDTYSYNHRTISVGNKISFLTPFDFSSGSNVKFERGHTRQYVRLDFNQPVVTVELKDSQCTDIKTPPQAIIELVEPGSTQVRFFTDIDNGPKTMRFQTSHAYNNATPLLRMTLDSACSFTFKIHPGSITNQISCIVRDRWSSLYMIVVSLLLLVVSTRIDHGRENTPTLVLTLVLSFAFGLTFEVFIALAVIIIIAIATCYSVIFLGSVAHGIAVRFLARAITFSTTWSDWLLGGLNQLPFVTTIIVLSLIPATCGALAMIISVFLFFLKLTRMYEDYLEELLLASMQHFKWIGRLRSKGNDNDNKKEESTRKKIVNQLILFILWCFAAVPAVPSVLVWAKNFSYDTRLTTEDPILLGSWIVLVTCGTLGLVRISPNYLGNRSQILAYLIRFVSWVVLSTAAAHRPSFYQWCMAPVVAGIVFIVAVNSVIPERSVR